MRETVSSGNLDATQAHFHGFTRPSTQPARRISIPSIVQALLARPTVSSRGSRVSRSSLRCRAAGHRLYIAVSACSRRAGGGGSCPSGSAHFSASASLLSFARHGLNPLYSRGDLRPEARGRLDPNPAASSQATPAPSSVGRIADDSHVSQVAADLHDVGLADFDFRFLHGFL